MAENDKSKTNTPSLEELLIKQNELALRKDQREQAEWEAKQAAAAEDTRKRAFAVERHMSRDKQKVTEAYNKIKRCNHLMGKGAFRQTPALAGGKFNIHAHQLPGGEYVIGCRNRCGLRLFQGDTAAKLFRTDSQGVFHEYPNASGWSFEDAWAHLPPDSVSRSEVIFVKAGDPAPVAAK